MTQHGWLYDKRLDHRKPAETTTDSFVLEDLAQHERLTPDKKKS